MIQCQWKIKNNQLTFPLQARTTKEYLAPRSSCAGSNSRSNWPTGPQKCYHFVQPYSSPFLLRAQGSMGIITTVFEVNWVRKQPIAPGHPVSFRKRNEDEFCSYPVLVFFRFTIALHSAPLEFPKLILEHECAQFVTTVRFSPQFIHIFAPLCITSRKEDRKRVG